MDKKNSTASSHHVGTIMNNNEEQETVMEDDEDEDDEFADEEFDKILAEAGDDNQLLRDCEVREEAVTYVVCDLVDKVVKKIQPPNNERRIQLFDFFAKRLADESWKTNK